MEPGLGEIHWIVIAISLTIVTPITQFRTPEPPDASSRIPQLILSICRGGSYPRIMFDFQVVRFPRVSQRDSHLASSICWVPLRIGLIPVMSSGSPIDKPSSHRPYPTLVSVSEMLFDQMSSLKLRLRAEEISVIRLRAGSLSSGTF